MTNENSNLCRVCLTSNDDNRCIFRRSSRDKENTLDISEKLKLCAGVEILENDGLPTNICVVCVSKVDAAHELREQCQKADAKLRELYGKPIVTADTCKSTRIKDQSCQTDESTILVKIEENSGTVLDNLHMTSKDNSLLDSRNIYDGRNKISCTEEELNDNSKFIEETETLDNDVKCEQLVQGTTVVKRETYRTRRKTMFKRVTSMENLKNHKERQRQYIKKNINIKCDSLERDSFSGTDEMSNQMERISVADSNMAFECSKCNRCYSTKKALDRHVLTHADKKYKCEKCDKRFFNVNKLLQHCKLHRSKEPVVCKICSKNFRKIDTMVRHLNVHKRANPKEVLSILKEIRDKRKLENDTERLEIDIQNSVHKQLAEEKFVKNEESDTTKEINKLSDTIEKIDNTDTTASDSNSEGRSDCFDNGQTHRCKQCNKSYSTERSLQRHQLIHEEKKFVCNVCNMKFFRLDRLKSHRNRYGHNEDKDCSVLQKPPDDKSAIKLINSWIREELDSDNEEKGFPCKICGKSYDTKKSLLKHQSNTHEVQEGCCTSCDNECTCISAKGNQKTNEKSRIFTCDECNKTFEKEMKLQRHMRIHERTKEQQDSNFKRFLCHICSKTFRQNTGLMFHMRTHTGYKPHVCKYCGRGFTSNSNCINHERTHTGDRPFVCHFCSAAFAKSCTLKAHITTHTGEANYHCKTCGKSFRRLKYLKEHRFTHTGEKPYACKICGTAYSHSGSLFVHEKKCKAQYNNYQSPTSAQGAQTYCQNQGNVCANATPVIPPIITTLPQAHLNNINNTLNSQSNNKNYIDGVQRLNAHGGVIGSSTLHVHQNPDIPDVASAVRNIAIIGQVFHS